MGADGGVLMVRTYKLQEGDIFSLPIEHLTDCNHILEDNAILLNVRDIYSYWKIKIFKRTFKIKKPFSKRTVVDLIWNGGNIERVGKGD